MTILDIQRCSKGKGKTPVPHTYIILMKDSAGIPLKHLQSHGTTMALNLAVVSQMLSHIAQIILTADAPKHVKGSSDE